MPGLAPTAYTDSHRLLDDGSVTFKCSQDAEQWPWLALHPFDPIVVQTVNYWASVESGAARGSFDPDKWSALTQTEWECGEEGVGHAARGISDVIGTESEPRFRLTFYDADDAMVYRMSGKGVIFQNRDFESWRAKAKKQIKRRMAASEFDYAPAEAVGMPEQKLCFLSPVTGGDIPSARGLTTRENGFIPNHPHHSGSGDHVNANHLADIGRQFAQAVSGGNRLVITGGEMRFMRYVELDQIFEITQTAHDPKAGHISVLVTQAGKDCAVIKQHYVAA